MARDMTQAQFDRELEKRGLDGTDYTGFHLGYVRFPCGLHISRFNAGTNRRAQLAYLLDAHKRHHRHHPEYRKDGCP